MAKTGTTIRSGAGIVNTKRKTPILALELQVFEGLDCFLALV